MDTVKTAKEYTRITPLYVNANGEIFERLSHKFGVRCADAVRWFDGDDVIWLRPVGLTLAAAAKLRDDAVAAFLGGEGSHEIEY